jgi:hypothetical protein
MMFENAPDWLDAIEIGTVRSPATMSIECTKCNALWPKKLSGDMGAVGRRPVVLEDPSILAVYNVSRSSP